MPSSLRVVLSAFLVWLLLASVYLPLIGPAKAVPTTEDSKRSRLLSSPNRVRLTGRNTTRGGQRKGELLVRFRGADSNDAASLVQLGLKAVTPLRGKSRVYRMVVGQNQDLDSIALSLRNNPKIEWVEPNYLIYQDSTQLQNKVGPQSGRINKSANGPNDPRFQEQWALKNYGGNEKLFGSDIQVMDLWKRSTGSADLLVAVIDSGIDFSHPDLKNQQWKNKKEKTDSNDDDKNGFVDDGNGWDFVANDSSASDGSGHGTNVAGIIAAEGDNNIGIAGVLWHASLMNLRVLDSQGVGDVASAIEALDYATEKGAHVMNLSWGTDERSVFLGDALRRTSKYGAVVVCSAGNESHDLRTEAYYPAAFNLPNLVSVGSTDGSDLPTSDSNFGALLPTISAPGSAILTTAQKRRGAEEQYEVVSGTSAAAAFVSGLVGIFKIVAPLLKGEEIKQALIRGARKSEALAQKNEAGGVVSGLGGINASQPDSGDDKENPKPKDSTGEDGSGGTSLIDSASSAKGEAGKSKVLRRRHSAGPGLPNLDTQKHADRSIPAKKLPVSPKAQNCSPWEASCGGSKILSPNPTMSPRRGNQDRLVASSNASLQQLVNVINATPELSPLTPLLERTMGTRSSFMIENAAAYFTGPTVAVFVDTFYDGALHRNPTTEELNFWSDQLKDAKTLGSGPVLDMAKYLGNAVFQSSEYSAASNTLFVTDLYYAYLQVAPDSGGLSFWTGEANTYGREHVRNAFAISGDYSTLVASIDMGIYPTSNGNFSTHKIDIVNRSGSGGEDLLSGNVNFSIPILGLPGRAGMNLGLGLSYNSRVWAKANSTVAYDTDRGFPGPGFRLGFPVIQPKFYNSATGTASYLMVTPDGGHIELRQMGSSAAYQSEDSTYTYMVDGGSALVVLTTNGSRMYYVLLNGQWVCAQVMDRNGNYLTINYNGSGNISTIIDTLDRTVTFNYDGNGRLQTITQPWTVGGSTVTHYWAVFTHSNITIDTNYSGVYIAWPRDNDSISTLAAVEFADGSHVDFGYNDFGQVDEVKRYALDDSLQSQTRYVYTTPSADVPTVTDRYDWSRYWNGDTNGAVASGEEVRIQFTTGLSGGTRTIPTSPDNIVYKEFYGSSTWQRGLTTSTEVWVGSTKEKWTTAAWDQDNTGVSYFTNPRVTETNVYDAASNRRRTATSYTGFGLPDVVTEYEANASTVYRKTDTDYVTSATYLNLRVIGLPSKIEIKDASNNVKSKTEFTYDEGSSYMTSVTGKDNHDDTNYSSSFVAGRGNLCIVKKYEIGGSGYIENKMGYNSLGQMTFTKDGENHQVDILYADSFSDGVNNRNTHAYPTNVEDADNYDALSKYNYDTGAVTYTEDPLGAIVTTTFDSIGRLDAVTNLASSSDTSKQARTRYEYGADYKVTWVRGSDGTSEAYTNTQFDGAGRVRFEASDFPSSLGGYKATYAVYDILGRLVEQGNPTEVDEDDEPYGEDVAGFAFTTQTYDFQNRPLVKTNQDATTKTMSYAGCGCAGGQSVTILDELGRKQMIYSDVFGRNYKTEVYSAPSTVDASSITTYDLLDRVTNVREYAGNTSSGTYQDTTSEYDGYGRMWKIHKPEFASSTYFTTTYNDDNTRATITDPLGNVATYTYNNRHLVTEVSYAPASGVQDSPTVTYTYDAAGNRLTMDSSVAEVDYEYDTDSRLESETQSIDGLTGDFTLTYTYKPSGALETIEDPFDRVVTYSYYKTGELESMTGTNYPDISDFISSTKYRAWGGPQKFTYGNGIKENTEYNERMLPTAYELEDMVLPNTSLFTDRSTFDYYDDGRLNHALYATGSNKFDRKQEYDFAGRIKEAYTDAEARGGSPTNPRTNPYRQSFQYDAFGHLSERSGFLWRKELPTESHTFTNNRTGEYTYDAAGKITVTDSGSFFAYDAAGLKYRSIVSQSDDLGSGNFRSLGAEIIHSFDGDGVVRKRVEDRLNEQDIAGIYGSTQTTTTIYNLWSTVLGALVGELEGDGDQTLGLIYAGSERIARIDVTPSTSSVVYEYTNSVTGTEYEGTHTGSAGRAREYDPMGAQIPRNDPYLTQNRLYGDQKTNGKLFVNDASPYGYGDYSCTMDGMMTPCSIAMRAYESGAAYEGSYSYYNEVKVELTYKSGRKVVMKGIAPRSFNMNVTWKGELAVIALQTFQENYAKGLVSALNSAGREVDYRQKQLAAATQQRTYNLPTDLRSRVESLLSTCGDKLQQIMAEVDSIFPNNPVVSGNVLDLFDLVNKQGGFRFEQAYVGGAPKGGTVSGFITKLPGPNNGTPGQEMASVIISPILTLGRLDEVSVNNASMDYARTAIGELAHLNNPNGRMSDRMLALAAFKVTNIAGLPATEDVDENSTYFHHRVVDVICSSK